MAHRRGYRAIGGPSVGLQEASRGRYSAGKAAPSMRIWAPDMKLAAGETTQAISPDPSPRLLTGNGNRLLSPGSDTFLTHTEGNVRQLYDARLIPLPLANRNVGGHAYGP